MAFEHRLLFKFENFKHIHTSHVYFPERSNLITSYFKGLSKQKGQCFKIAEILYKYYGP